MVCDLGGAPVATSRSPSRWSLSDEALAVFSTFARGLAEKVAREGAVPEVYRFRVAGGRSPVWRELERAGVVRLLSREAGGVLVYEHDVDQEAALSLLPARVLH